MDHGATGLNDFSVDGLAAGFIGIPRKIMALKNLKAIIIDLNYIKGILFFLDLTGE